MEFTFPYQIFNRLFLRLPQKVHFENGGKTDDSYKIGSGNIRKGCKHDAKREGKLGNCGGFDLCYTAISFNI